MSVARENCKACKGKGWYHVDEWIGPLQGRKDCTCVPSEHAVTCAACGEVLDMRDLAQCFCHGLPVPDEPGQFMCLTPEEIEEHRAGVFKDAQPGHRLQQAINKLLN